MLVLVVIGTVAGGTSVRAGVIGHGSVRLAPAGSVVLGSPFQPVSGATGFEASGDYVLLSTGVEPGGSDTKKGWTVTDERTGATTALNPLCQPVDLGPPWVLLSCAQNSGVGVGVTSYDAELFSLSDGSQQVVTPGRGMPPQCSQLGPDRSVDAVCTDPAAVGADWIQWNAGCDHDCGVTSYFQNIQTGELRGDPTNATTFADLNSPTLAEETCPGVRLMPTPDFQRPWGSLTYEGPFALVTGTDSSVFLERCGTGMRRQLPLGAYSCDSCVPASNDSAIVWQADPTQLRGLFLPSLQRFTIPLPSAIVKPPGSGEAVPVGNLELTSDALYVEDDWDGTFWQTASPAALPLNTSRPSLKRSGGTLSCRRGSWRNADRFSYAWRVNGVAHKGANTTLALGKARKRRSASCSVTASNAVGTTTASSAQLRVR